MRFLLASMAVMACSAAHAALFCESSPSGSQDCKPAYEHCAQLSGRLGTCLANREEDKPQPGAPFCAVTSSGARCSYWDAETCRQAAASQGGVCTFNPQR